MRTRVV
jgi:Helix-turn-helix of DDE superfamily endonuclease